MASDVFVFKPVRINLERNGRLRVPEQVRDFGHWPAELDEPRRERMAQRMKLRMRQPRPLECRPECGFEHR